MDRGLVQPIAVSKRAASHEDTVVAVAMASAGAWLSHTDMPVWDQWFAGKFTKTVRRGNDMQLAALQQHAAYIANYNGSKALGFVPCSYPALIHPLPKMQVSGTDFHRTGKWPVHSSGPKLFINAGLNMSTGKCAAQVAHAVFIWLLSKEPQQRQAWFAKGMPMAIWEVDQARFNEVKVDAPAVVRDAGLTEVDPGTDTVIVW